MRKYTLFMNINNIVIGKSICYINLTDNEIEITEEQYNEINDFPLKLTLDENGKAISWVKTELPYVEPVIELVKPTLEERLTIAEDTINFLLGL